MARWLISLVFAAMSVLCAVGAASWGIDAAHETERFRFIGNCAGAVFSIFGALIAALLSYGVSTFREAETDGR